MLTADHQNAFFINKIEGLVTTMPSTDKSPESPNTSMSATDLSAGKGGKLSKWLSPSQGAPLKVNKAFKFKFVTASDVTKIISNLKITKSLGVDDLATEVLKKGVITLSGPVHDCAMSVWQLELCRTSLKMQSSIRYTKAMEKILEILDLTDL